MDLSKASNCLNNEVLLSKFNTYGYSKIILQMVYSYLAGRMQRVQINRPLIQLLGRNEIRCRPRINLRASPF